MPIALAAPASCGRSRFTEVISHSADNCPKHSFLSFVIVNENVFQFIPAGEPPIQHADIGRIYGARS
jgi:hypothetical protein